MCSGTVSLGMASLRSYSAAICHYVHALKYEGECSCKAFVSHSHLQCPDAVVGEHLLLSERNLKGSKDGAPTLWPVLLTLLFAVLLEVGHHDNGGWPFLPHQPPKVNQQVFFGAFVKKKQKNSTMLT